MTSFQSSVSGNETCAPLAGARSVGATGVPPDGGGEPPACTVNTAPHVVFSSANTFDCAAVVTAVVDTVNVAVVAPAGTVSVAGTVAGLMADSWTTAPPDGAGALSVTVAVDDDPPGTLVGLSASPVTQKFFDVLGLIVTFALADDAP